MREAIRKGDRSASVAAVVNVLRARESPPTYFRSTKVSAGTQAIVDAYGIANYQASAPRAPPERASAVRVRGCPWTAGLH